MNTLLIKIMIALQTNYIALAVKQRQFKRRFKIEVESLVYLALYFIYAA